MKCTDNGVKVAAMFVAGSFGVRSTSTGLPDADGQLHVVIVRPESGWFMYRTMADEASRLASPEPFAELREFTLTKLLRRQFPFLHPLRVRKIVPRLVYHLVVFKMRFGMIEVVWCSVTLVTYSVTDCYFSHAQSVHSLYSI